MQEPLIERPRRAHGDGVRDGEVHKEWIGRTRVVLQPIAPPSILGLYAFAGATLMVACHLAGWYGTPRSGLYLFPFVAVFGGIAQFLAGMWSYRARDGLATAMHGMWGSFWIGYGILNLLFATGTLVDPGTHFPELGFWFIALGAITAMGALAALAENLSLTAVLTTLAAGSLCAATAYLSGASGWLHVAGWLFVFSAGFAWYTASAMMLEGSFKRVVLPLGKYRPDTNVPGAVVTDPLEYEHGLPGVKVGQ
jgi:succinate-acetate transporter protein